MTAAEGRQNVPKAKRPAMSGPFVMREARPQLSKKLRSFLDRDGCLSFLKAFASI
jgi:hypothetical protein